MTKKPTLRVCLIFCGGLIAPLFFIGCQSFGPPLDPKIWYRRDIQVDVAYDRDIENFPKEGFETHEGVSVLKRAKTYAFRIRPKGGAKMDLITITTCHREDAYEKQSPGFLGGQNAFLYQYSPVPGIEDIGSCVQRINILDSGGGKHGWAFFDFEPSLNDPMPANLKATLTCNGVVRGYNGVSACQSKVGLLQRIEFGEPVFISSDVCPINKPMGMVVEFKMPKGECVFAFMGKSKEHHRLTTVGYEEIAIRETEK